MARKYWHGIERRRKAEFFNSLLAEPKDEHIPVH